MVLSDPVWAQNVPRTPNSPDAILEAIRRTYKEEPEAAIAELLSVREAASPKHRAQADCLLMKCYEQKGRIDSATFYGIEAITLAKKLENKDREAYYSQRLARMFRNTGRLEEALIYYEQAIGIYESVPDSENIAYMENFIGISHKKMGNYEEALEHYRRSLRIRTILGHKNQIA